jgi:hypothetical protein
MPPALEAKRTQAGLHLTHASGLHAAPLLTAWTACRDGPRRGLQSRGGQAHHGFQQRRRGAAPSPQHTVFVLGQAVITMGSSVLQHGSAEFQQRLYDLVREVVGVHVAFLDPSLRLTAAGLFV